MVMLPEIVVGMRPTCAGTASDWTIWTVTSALGGVVGLQREGHQVELVT